MQKLKLFLLFFVAAVATCNFTSCKDDDDSSGNAGSIVGTWVGSDEYGSYTYVFQANGRFTESWTETNGKGGTDSGSYTYDGNTLTIIYDDGYTDSFSGVVVSGDKLIYGGQTLTRV